MGVVLEWRMTLTRVVRIAVLLTPLVVTCAVAAQQNAAPPPLEPNPRAPLYQRTGEQYRVYDFPGTGESIPYRLFVPSRWKPGAR